METTNQEWDDILAVNLRSQFIILKEIIPTLLQQRWGVIVAISSETAFAPGPGRVAYSSSKAASHFLLAGLAAELENTNISIVEILPQRLVRTPGLERRRPKSFDYMGYMKPAEIADAVMTSMTESAQGMVGYRLVEVG